MDPLMFKAALEGSTGTLLGLLRDDPLILERTTTSSDTPLHIAAMLGHLDFVKELIKHKTNPVDYVREPNQHGFSAIHLASANGHIDVVQELLEVSNELCYLQGKDAMTPLHCACIKGRVETINHLLSVSPTTVLQYLTVRGESALHLAVKNNKLEAVQTLVEWVKQNNQLEILNLKDEEGNTILHLAAARRNRQTLELVLECNATSPGLVQINAKNESRLTPLDLVRLIPCEFSYDDIERLLRDAGADRGNRLNDIAPATEGHQNETQSEPRNLSREEILNWEDYFKFDFNKSNPDRTRSDLLVVTVLMATATYQAVLSPPGGFKDEGSHKGEALLASRGTFAFIWFIFFNSAGFFTSLFILMTLTNGYPLFWELYVAILAMFVTYDSAIVSFSPPGRLQLFAWLLCVIVPLSIPTASNTIRTWYKLRRTGASAYIRHQAV